MPSSPNRGASFGTSLSNASTCLLCILIALSCRYFAEAGLCGVHCLNNLLQGPYFGAVELMEIALDLDRKEKELMAELGTDTPEYEAFAKVCVCLLRCGVVVECVWSR